MPSKLAFDFNVGMLLQFFHASLSSFMNPFSVSYGLSDDKYLAVCNLCLMYHK